MLMVVGVAWLVGFGVLSRRATRSFRAYVDKVSDSSGEASAHEAMRHALEDGAMQAPAIVVAQSLRALLRPAPTMDLEAERARVKSAFALAYAYIPVTIVPALLLGRMLNSVVGDFAFTGPGPVILGLVAIAVGGVAAVTIALRVLRPSHALRWSQWAAIIVGIVSLAFATMVALRLMP